MSMGSRYIINLQENLRVNLRKPVEKEMLHQLRVIIKKLVALWQIHPIGSTIAFKTSFPTIHKLFKLAASTRDLQMILECLHTLPGFNDFPMVEKWIKTDIKKGKAKIKEKIGQRKFRFSIYNEIRLFLEYYRMASGYLLKNNRKKFRIHVFEEMDLITGVIPETLHQLRKNIKAMIFQVDAFPGNLPETGKHENRAVLDRLQSKLGIWHDWWNTRNYLENKQELHPDIPFSDILDTCAKKEQILRREILRDIKLLIQHKEITVNS